MRGAEKGEEPPALPPRSRPSLHLARPHWAMPRREKILLALVGRGQMALQIHRVVKESQDLDHLAALIMSSPEHDEMSPLASLASDMKRGYSLGDVAAFPCTRDGRAGGQIVQRNRERLGMDARLRLAKLHRRPAQDFLEVGLGGCRQADRPAGHPCRRFERVPAAFPAIAPLAIAVKWRLSAEIRSDRSRPHTWSPNPLAALDIDLAEEAPRFARSVCPTAISGWATSAASTSAAAQALALRRRGHDPEAHYSRQRRPDGPDHDPFAQTAQPYGTCEFEPAPLGCANPRGAGRGVT